MFTLSLDIWRCGLKHEPYLCNAVRVKKLDTLVDDKRVSNLAEHCYEITNKLIHKIYYNYLNHTYTCFVVVIRVTCTILQVLM